MLTHEEQQKAIGTLLKRKENALCADCNSKMPCWASLDFGVFVCLNCSGAHRALGPSITRVKSARLDTWSRDWLENMLIGNSTINQYWEAGLTQSDRRVKPNTNSSLDAIIKYVQDKYVRKLYADPNEQLDPLKKAKSGQGIKSQISTEQKPKPKVMSGKAPKSAIIEGEATNKANGKGVADFTVFDQFLKVEKPKPKGENLISFEEEKGKALKKNATFDDFQFIVPNVKPKQETFNKQQFMSMGGIQPSKTKNEVNFEGFSKIQKKDSAHQHKNLLSFEHNGHVKTEQNHLDFNNYGLPSYNNIHSHANQFNQQHPQQQNQLNTGHYNKHTYATMGGMHPSSKVDSQLTNYNKNLNHYQHHHEVKKHDSGLGSNNLNFAQGISLGPQKVQKMKTNENKITLQANINFDEMRKEATKPQKDVKSWIDDWK